MRPTERSLKLMRGRGYYCVKVEHWNPFAKVRQDLCGGDILALKEGEPPILVQATTSGNRKARLTKLDGLQSAALWKSTGGRLVVHGWKPITKSRKHHEVEEIEWGTN